MRATIAKAIGYLHYSTLLSTCGKEGNHLLGRSFHASIITSSHRFDPFNNDDTFLVLSNSLIAMYSKSGRLYDATRVFDQMKIKDTISWNSIIWGCLNAQDFQRGLGYFNRMRESKIYQLNEVTVFTVLSYCNHHNLLELVQMVHSLVISNGFEQDVPVGNALVTGYLKCGCLESGQRVFDEIPVKTVISWTAIISGLAQNVLCKESFLLFLEMRRRGIDANSLTYSRLLHVCSGMRALIEGQQIHGLVLKSRVSSGVSRVCIENAVMNMYSKCGSMKDAYRIFESAEQLNKVSITVILTGFAQNGMEEEALELFVNIMTTETEIDSYMVAAVLRVFGVVTSLALGKLIHSFVIKKRFGFNLYVTNGLINMYSECGEFEESIKIFKRMRHKNLVSWNSMIAGFTRHGSGSKALQLYEEMKLEGVEPTDITFLSLLHACSHAGSIEKGIQLLESMSNVYGISPRMEHYACVVDLLGRAGKLEDAKCFIEELPVEPTALLWQALLGASRIYGNLEMGTYATHKLLQVDPDCSGAYVLMANIYSYEGKWKHRAGIIKKMKEMGVKKETGISWIEVEKGTHRFDVRDRGHPQAEIIYKTLDGLIGLMKDEGYVPNERFMVYDLDVR